MPKQKIRIKLKSYDHNLIDQASSKIIDAAEKSNCEVIGPIPMPTKKEVVTVIRSPHKYSYTRDQFETRTHKRLIEIVGPNSKSIEWISKLDLPAGVDVNIKL